MKNFKLTPKEMLALTRFFGRYMVARKAYEAKMNDLRLRGDMDFSLWGQYMDTKQDCFNELVLALPEVRWYGTISNEAGSGFWRDAVMLRPQAIVDGVIRYRKEKAAEKEQREKEKAILTGQEQKGKKQNGKHQHRRNTR